MKQLSDADFQALADVYMFANTPQFLFRHFRKDSGVQRVARGEA